MRNNVVRQMRGELTQAELAEKVGLTQSAIARYENGSRPKKGVLEKIAKATGYKISFSMSIEKIEPDNQKEEKH